MDVLLVVFLLISINVVLPQHKNHKGHRQTQKSDWMAPMELDVRSMHRYCAGECYFLPEECKKPEALSQLKCRNIVSIRKYKPHCERAVPAVADLCKRDGHLYVISLLRNLNAHLVRSKDRDQHNYKKGPNGTMKCSSEPFVAISFTDDDKNSVVPSDLGNNKVGDVFYACIANQAYVTSWVKPVDPPPQSTVSCLIDGTKRESLQLMDTLPYPPMGVSVLWSNIAKRYDQFAIGCKFIISDEEADLTIKINEQTIPIPVFHTKKLKIANGFAYVQNGIVEDVYFSSAPSALRALPNTFQNKTLEDDASLVSVEGMTDWNISHMEPPIQAPEPFLAHQYSEIAEQSMANVYSRCLSKKALCFTRNDERSCIIRQNCHLLASIRSLNKNFTKLRFKIISQQAHRKGFVYMTHPQSWAAIGFSNDTKMGKDLVFTCVYRGTTQIIARGYNAKQMFIQPVMEDWVNQDTEDFVQIKNYVSMDSESTMCVFDLTTKDVIVKAFYYSKESASAVSPDTWSELYWSFKNHEFFVFLAQGTTMYQDRISQHTYRSVSNIKFSQKLYMEQVNGQGPSLTSKSVFIFTLVHFMHF